MKSRESKCCLVFMGGYDSIVGQSDDVQDG
jgi:hypothetical protein